MMEVEGTKIIFERSIANKNVRSLKYCSDVVNKVFQEEKNVYSPECVAKYV